MAGCIYCIDNDILKKLVAFELFDSTLKIFDIDNNDIRILRTAKNVFSRQSKQFQRKKNLRQSDEVVNWERLLELTKKLPYVVSEDTNLRLLNKLLELGLDEGDAILACSAIAIIEKNDSAMIFTGDKKFIKALAKADLHSVNTHLKSRIWCLEQVILRNIDYLGFETVRDQVVPAIGCDQTTKIVFHSGNQTTEENARLSLYSYISDLQKNSNLLLNAYPNPPKQLF